MNEAAIELVKMVVALERCTYVRSLFHLTVECEMDYKWGHRVLQWAEMMEWVVVTRNGPGVPLTIVSTERGRQVVTMSESGVSPKWAEPVI